MSDRKSHFIEQIIEEDIKSGMSPKSLRLDFRQNLTDIYMSAT